MTECAAKGTGDDAAILNSSLSHVDLNGDAIGSPLNGKSLKDAFKEISEVHGNKMNASFIDGHAGTFDPVELIDKNIVSSGTTLNEDYRRR